MQPRLKGHGKIKGWEGSLPHNYWMHEFDRDMLRVGCVGAAAEGKQPASQ